MQTPQPLVIIRGGGELGSAVGHALFGQGFAILVLDRPLPTSLRLKVAFASAVVAPGGRARVCGLEAVHARTVEEIAVALEQRQVPVWTQDPALLSLSPAVLVDARMRALTEPGAPLPPGGPVVIGLGPGFVVGRDAHYVLESNRGPTLGQVITEGGAQQHTGVPGEVQGLREERILRSPVAGQVVRVGELGAFVEAGEVVARVAGQPVLSPLSGMVRGLKLTGVEVGAGHKIGDVDPRRDLALLSQMTDKALALGQAAVEALALAGISPQNPSSP